MGSPGASGGLVANLASSSGTRRSQLMMEGDGIGVESEAPRRPKDNRSRIYWTNPAHREMVQKEATRHGLHETDFLETLVLAWFDPLHFSRMLRWLYPNGHPAFETSARGASSDLALRQELEDLRVELEAARRERDEATGRASALESELQKAHANEREALVRLQSVVDASSRLAEATLEGAEEVFVGQGTSAVVKIVEKVLRERRAARVGRKGVEPDVSDAVIVEEGRKMGLDKQEVYAQLRAAEASGALRRHAGKYGLPARGDR